MHVLYESMWQRCRSSAMSCPSHAMRVPPCMSQPDVKMVRGMALAPAAQHDGLSQSKGGEVRAGHASRLGRWYQRHSYRCTKYRQATIGRWPLTVHIWKSIDVHELCIMTNAPVRRPVSKYTPLVMYSTHKSTQAKTKQNHPITYCALANHVLERSMPCRSPDGQGGLQQISPDLWPPSHAGGAMPGPGNEPKQRPHKYQKKADKNKQKRIGVQ